MANCNPPVKGQAFDLSASLSTSAGLITNPGTLTLKISKDFGDWADSHNAASTPTEEDSTYGQIKIALDTTDMNADVVDVYLVDNTSGCIPFKATIYTCSATRGLAGTALPNAAADAAGGLPISDAGGLDLDTYIKRLEAAFTSTIAGYIDAAISSRSDGTGVTLHSDYDAAKTAAQAGNAMTLADDAITAAKFDQSTAYPLASSDGSDLTACATATGFSTHSAADVVTALGTGSTLTDCATATGFSTHSAADVVTALGTGSTLTDCATATGFSTLDAAGVRTAVGMASADLDTQLAALPTAAENADALIGRNIAGGSSTGRIVKDVLRLLRNKVTLSGGTMTVYDETDAGTPAWTATVTGTAGADPVTTVDPA